MNPKFYKKSRCFLFLFLLAACFFAVDNAFGQSGTINTVAGTGVAAFGGDGTPAISAELNTPLGLWVDAAGNIYIADQGNNAVRKVTVSTGIISTIAGNGTPGFGGDGGAATSANLNAPSGICMDLAGNLYIGDRSNHRIRKVTPAGIISTVAGTGTPGFAGDGGPASSAELNNPYGVWVDASGNILITDQGNLRVRQVDGVTGNISTIAGTGAGGFCCDGSPATAASFTTPAGICKDAGGTVYFSTQGGDARVRKIDPSGIIHTEEGTGTTGFTGDCGPATVAEVFWPQGLGIDATGNVYLATSSDYRIRVVVSATGIIHTVAGSGGTVFSGDGGPALSAGMNPYGVFVDASGNIYIAGDNRVREVTIAANKDSVSFCPGGSAILGSAVSYADSFLWNTGATTSSITVSAAGTYWVKMFICDYAVLDTFVVFAQAPIVDLGPDTSICTGVTLTLQSSSSYTSPTYLWSTGSATPTINVSASGTYWLKVTDGGCSTTDTIHINVAALTPVHLGPDDTICAGHSVTLSSSDTYISPSYLWSTGSTTPSVSVSATGAYWLDVTVNGCTGKDTINVTSIAYPVVSLGDDTAICDGTSLMLQSSGVYTGPVYLWNTGSTAPTISVTTAGAYWLDVAISGCTSSDTINVAVTPTPDAPFVSSSAPVCAGDTLYLTSSDSTAGITYSWAGPDSFVSVLENPDILNVPVVASGTYTVTVTLGSCTATATLAVSVTPTPPLIATSNSPVCTGSADTLRLLAVSDPGATYLWSGPYVFASGAQYPWRSPVIMEYAGVYQVTAFLNGCKSALVNDTVVLRQTPPSPGVPWLTYCQFYNAPALQAMGDGILWYPASDSTGSGSLVAPVPPTDVVGVTYYYTSQTILSCTSAIDSIRITVNPKPTVTLSPGATVCPRDSVGLTATDTDPIAHYHWSPGIYLDDTSGAVVTARPEADVNYTAVATNQFGCSDTAKVAVMVHPAAVVELGDSVTILPGDTYQINPQTNCTSFSWFPPAGLNNAHISNPLASPEISTMYIVKATNEWGCTASDSISVYVDMGAAFAMPNAFTPGSGTNNQFKIIVRGTATLNYFRIFDRWGIKVFETTNIGQGWDGNFKGAPQPEGVYIYEVQAVSGTGTQFNKHGNVTLLR